MWNKNITGGSYFMNCRESFVVVEISSLYFLIYLQNNAGKFVSAQVILK